MNQHHRLERLCAVCAQSFKARASDVRRGKGRLCSKRCSGRLGGQTQASRPLMEASHPQEKLGFLKPRKA